MMMLEYFQLPKLSAAELQRRISFAMPKEQNPYEQALALGKGAICMSGHFGNWEYMGALFAALQYPIVSLYQEQNNPYVAALIRDIRAKMNMASIPRGGGLNRFDPTKKKFARFVHDPKNPYSLSQNDVRAIYQDATGALWVGTLGGLNKLPSTSSGQTNSGEINSINEKAAQFIHFVNDANDPHSLSFDRILSIYESPAAPGTLWIGTWGGGLNKFDRDQEKFAHVANDPMNPNSLSNNGIWAIYEDSSSSLLWIGTDGGGLNRYDPAQDKFTHFVHDPKNSKSLSHDAVWAIHKSRDNTLWIGTDGGLDKLEAPGTAFKKLDATTAQFSHYVHDPDNPNSLSSNRVRCLYEDFRRAELWIGTRDGLNRLNRPSGKITRFVNEPNNPHSLSHNHIWSLYADHTGALWIGTSGGGLNRFDHATEQFTRYVHDPSNAHSLSHNRIFSIYEDSRHGGSTLWIGTDGGGLNQFDRATERFTHYTEKDGLPNNVIYGILAEENGQLWLSTNKGLSRFDPQTKSFRNFDSNDGLQSNEFNQGACHKSAVPGGRMFFGGINGLNAFYPDHVKDNPHPPPVVITAFKIFDKAIKLDRAPDNLETLALSYRDNFFSFEFAALHYANPLKNQYAYRLEGFDRDWIYCGARRYASYTNLDPGNYVFRVKGANNDGVWNETGTAIAITIAPPWWRTRWAYALYALALLAGIFATDRLQRRRVIQKERARAEIREAELRAQAAEAQAKILQAENERKELALQKANELKAAYQALAEAHAHLKATQAQLIQSEKLASLGQLTAGIAHEMKNPLNFVANFAVLTLDLTKELREVLAAQNDKLDAEAKASVHEVLQLLDQNVSKIDEHSKRADRIVKGMLQHSRGEKGERRPADVNAILDEYVMLGYHGMRGLDSTFNIKIEKEYDPAIGRVEVFPQDLSRVFLNLVNNACYATHEKKKTLGENYSPVLAVRTKNWDGKIEIRIRDNGPGIPPNLVDKIFNPFFTTKPTGQGTGLGLSISYDIIVQEHGGELRVETEPGKFAEFIIVLPKEGESEGRKAKSER
jgi:signal transduction histidine kinase/ligand-binding sensor domain-containing protein